MPSPSIKVENLRGKSGRTGMLYYQDGAPLSSILYFISSFKLALILSFILIITLLI